MRRATITTGEAGGCLAALFFIGYILLFYVIVPIALIGVCWHFIAKYW